MVKPPNKIFERIRDTLGPKGWSTEPGVLAPHLREWRERYSGETEMLVMPASVEEVAAVVALCGEGGIGIVPQGGNTGLVGGQVPARGQILLSLKRMNRIRNIDAAGNTACVEAGVVLADLQAAAQAAERYFPLSLASEGSAMIGGLLSTNAGGVNVLRYGMARDLTLGLEAVLPDGRIWSNLKGLRKDNTGYDLKQLFIGAEGTLGVITAAVVKLFPRPGSQAVALVGVESPARAVELFSLTERASGGQVSSFELMPRIGLDFVLHHVRGVRDPLGEEHPWYALVEIATGSDEARTLMESVLERGVERGLIGDGVIAENNRQAAELWRLREALSEVQKYEGGSIKHDVSVPISAIPDFIERANKAVAAVCPGIRPVPFGHVGDGNVHYNLSQPLSGDMAGGRAAFLARWEELSAIVHDIVIAMGGSISAEHGIGQMKREMLARTLSPVELDLMRAVKQALDPKGIMNPGKLL